MDINKKFLYFNTTATDSDADGGVQDGAVTVPVSTLVAFDVRAGGTIIAMIKEAVQTDTTDVTISRTSTDPRDIIEKIVNEINFSKDAMIVVGDDNTSEYIHPDIDGIDSISAAPYSSPLIKLGSDIHAFRQQATEPGAGFSASDYTFNTGSVGTINGEVLTTIFLDIADLGLSSGTTANDAIGIATSSDPAYFTRITTAVNGIVYAGELICVEAPAGGEDSIGVFANSSGTIAPDASASEHAICAASNQTLGKRTAFTITSAGNQDDYLYLVQGDTTDAAYTAGKFIVRLFGAPTVNLNTKT